MTLVLRASRLTDVSDRRARLLGVVGAYTEQAARAGRYYGATFEGADVVAAAAQFLNWRVINPAGASTTTVITLITARFSAARTFAVQAPVTPASVALATAVTPREKRAGLAASTTTVSKTDAAAANLATLMFSYVIQANVVYEYREPIALPPNSSCDIQLGNTADAAGESGDVNVEFVEE